MARTASNLPATMTQLFQPSEAGPQYIFVSNLGHGMYGDVISVLDTRENRVVAIKKVRSLQSPLLLIRTLREIRVLSRLKHDGVTTMYNIHRAADTSNSKAIYIVQPAMTTDLAVALEQDSALPDEQKQLKAAHKQWIFYQVLRGMKYIHSANVRAKLNTLSHGNLKPSNILINAACQIKICDFRLARVMEVNAQGVSDTDQLNVPTLWYRPPELLFRSSIYDRSVDVWSTGCILAELLNGKALFRGVSCVDQIRVVLSVMGIPSAEEARYFESIGARMIQPVSGKTVSRAALWARLFPNIAPDVLDLLDRMLKFGPNERITIDEALNHPYVASCREQHTEFVCDHPFEQELNIGNLSESDLQKLLWQWITRYQASDPDWDSVVLQHGAQKN